MTRVLISKLIYLGNKDESFDFFPNKILLEFLREVIDPFKKQTGDNQLSKTGIVFRFLL